MAECRECGEPFDPPPVPACVASVPGKWDAVLCPIHLKLHMAAHEAWEEQQRVRA